MSACNHGFLDAARLLIDVGKANINLKNDDGWSALMFACQGGHNHIVQLLLEYDVDVNSKNQFGFTPIMKACEKGHANIVQLLLSKTADFTTKNELGETLLMDACRDGFIGIVKLLIEYGADKLELDLDGKSALDHAREWGRSECVSFLQEVLAIDIK